MKQFISMLNGAVVKRYDVNEETKERTVKQIIQPMYICSTKQRVMYDLVNKAKNFTLPCVCVSLTGISLSMDRMAAKFTPRTRFSNHIRYTYTYPSPVNLSFKVTIIAKYITDIYQIYAKICSQFQNSQCFSWYVPHEGDVDKSQYEEIISQAQWDGNISFDLKPERRETDEDRFTGDMTFTVTGWIFSNILSIDGNIILDIGTTNYIPDYLNSSILMESSFQPLVQDVIKDKNLPYYKNPREWNNAHPRITNLFRTFKINGKDVFFYLDKHTISSQRITPIDQETITVDGYNLEYINVLLVPKNKEKVVTENEWVEYDYSDNKNTLFPLRESNEEKERHIGGYKLKIIEQSRNKVVFSFEGISYNGECDIAIADKYDYDLISDLTQKTLSFTLNRTRKMRSF